MIVVQRLFCYFLFAVAQTGNRIMQESDSGAFFGLLEKSESDLGHAQWRALSHVSIDCLLALQNSLIESVEMNSLLDDDRKILFPPRTRF